MKTIKILLILSLFTTFLACKKEEALPEPTGVFEFKPVNNDLRAPAAIDFTPADNIENAVYLWDFGDGTTTTAKTPRKVYTTGGTKTVRLSVTANGVSKTENLNITIGNPFSKVRVMKSTILGAATAYPDGTGWDIATTGGDFLQGSADVYLIGRYDGVTTGESYNTGIKTNVTATQLTSGAIFWEYSSGFLLSSTAASAANLRIYLRDADVNGNLWASSHESMGYTDIKLSDLMQVDNKYPTSIELKGTASNTITGSQKYLNDALKIKLDLKWEE